MNSNNNDVGTSTTSIGTDIMLYRRVQQLEKQLGMYDIGSGIVTDDNNEIGTNNSTARQNTKQSVTSSTTTTPSITNKFDNTTDYNIESRIRALEDLCKNDTKLLSLQSTIDDWNIIDELMNELQLSSTTSTTGGNNKTSNTALTYQTQIMAPFIYRKYEILAYKEQYMKDIYHLQQITSLLSIGQSTMNHALTEEHVVNAPIILSSYTDETEIIEDDNKVKQLLDNITNLQQRIDKISQHLDITLLHYTNFITSLSEKIIIMNEHYTDTSSSS